MDYIPPVIFVPGITGTYLRDEYQVPPDRVWGVIEHNFARVALHPDDPRFEAVEPARVRADSLFEVPYKELIQELRYNLCHNEDQQVPVYPFAYDWRLPLDIIEKQFSDFVAEIIDRTKLISHYVEAGYGENPSVNLIGHSMGGLIITGYLDRMGISAPVSKVATLSTPYKGSFETVIIIATGTKTSEKFVRSILAAVQYLSFCSGVCTELLSKNRISSPKKLKPFSLNSWRLLKPIVIASINSNYRKRISSPKTGCALWVSIRIRASG